MRFRPRRRTPPTRRTEDPPQHATGWGHRSRSPANDRTNGGGAASAESTGHLEPARPRLDRPLAWFEAVDVSGVQAEIAASVLQQHASALSDDARPKVESDALNQRNQVPVLVGCAEIDGVAAIARARSAHRGVTRV